MLIWENVLVRASSTEPEVRGGKIGTTHFGAVEPYYRRNAPVRRDSERLSGDGVSPCQLKGPETPRKTTALPPHILAAMIWVKG